MNRVGGRWILVGAGVLSLIAVPSRILAHCDTMDGPVVQAGRSALERGDVRPAVVWVRPRDEAEIREAFAGAVAVRKLGPEAKRLADRYFFETLVRVHRAGEGAPYTGLKPAGSDPGRGIAAADKAVANGSPQALLDLLNDSLTKGVQERFNRVMQTRIHQEDDVNAGRSYVQAYAEFIHYIEAVDGAAAGTGNEADEGPEKRSQPHQEPRK